MEEVKKKRGRGRPIAHTDLPKEIRDNIVEANLPEEVLEAIKDVVIPNRVSDGVLERARENDARRGDKYIGNCPVTGKPVFE
jgi:hypothetical protein